MQQTGEVDGLLFVGGVLGVHFDEFRMTDNLLQALHADLSEILTHLLSEEGEEVHHVLGTTLEVLAQLGVLRGDAHRTGVRVTFAHHHTAENNQRQRTEREFVGTQHRHDDDVLGGLQLTVGLQANLIP